MSEAVLAKRVDATLAQIDREWEQRVAPLVPATFPGGAKAMIATVRGAFYKNPKLAECTPESIMVACQQSAELGLLPNTALQHAHWIPYRNNKRGVVEVQFIPGYPGLIDLAMRDGKVLSIEAECAFEKDRFISKRTSEGRVFEHEPYRGQGPRGAIIAAYAVAQLANGAHKHEIIERDEIEAFIRRFARDNTPWATDRVEMLKKTAIRRLSKTLPKSSQFAKALALQAATEANASTASMGAGDNFNEMFDQPVTEAPTPTGSNLDSVKNRLKAKAQPKPEPKPEVIDAEFSTDETPADPAPSTDEYWNDEEVGSWRVAFESCTNAQALQDMADDLARVRDQHPVPPEVRTRLGAFFREAKARLGDAE